MVILKILPFLLLEPGLMMKSVVSSDKFDEFHSNFISRVELENVTDGIMGCFLYVSSDKHQCPTYKRLSVASGFYSNQGR